MSWGPQTNPRGTALTGRRSTLPKPADLAEMVRDGQTAEDIAAAHGCTPSTVDRRLKQGGFNPRTGYRRDTELPPDTEDADDLAALLAIPKPGPWAEDAVCSQTDPEAFFPEKGGSTREAKAVCRACPVAADCLDYALSLPSGVDRFGIWGGLSERERRRLRAALAHTTTHQDRP